MEDKIRIEKAREHNLKNVSVEIPKNRLVVFTGLSGSGKSSLAFDTIYAEGQRRYVESLSSYARQFLGIMDKPDVDAIYGLSPAISIDQKSTSHNPRSTVGTITEVYDYLRLLFARVGHPHCPNCGREIEKQSTEQIVNKSLEYIRQMLKSGMGKNIKVMVLSPVVRDRKGEFSKLLDNLRQKGFTYVRIDNTVYGLDEDITLIKTNRHKIDVVCDRMVFDRNSFKKEEDLKIAKRRFSESMETALSLSEGLVIVSLVSDATFEFPEKPKIMDDHLYSQRFSCPVCNIQLPEIEPRIFSFNSPHGACQVCTGIGSLLKVDPGIVINPNLSIREGGILPFAKQVLNDTWYGRLLEKVCSEIGIDPGKPLKNVRNETRALLLNGTGDREFLVKGRNRQGNEVTIREVFNGIIPELEKRYQETDSEWVRAEIKKYMREEICRECMGKRLKKESLSVTLSGENISDITSKSVTSLSEWISTIDGSFTERDKSISNLIIKEIKARMEFLTSVGLTYLTLERKASTLSGGELQRIRLASQIGSGLTGVLYVLDEPSIGLHPKDNTRLINTLKKLRDLGNSVIVVEHDKEMMEHADMIYDFGPGAGKFGGNIIASGTPSEIVKDPKSITGNYLSGKKKISFYSQANTEFVPNYLTIKGCSENNLKNVNARFPLRRMVAVTGLSGSGKSSLVVDTLYHALASNFNPYHRENGGKFTSVEGLDRVRRVVLIDQSPIGRTPRSNPVTYTGAFTYIRELFSMLPDSKARGYSPGRFSFNVRGGRCEECEGEGVTKIEMQFLPDVYVKCDLCHGKRFNSETLEIKYKDKNISEILEMTVADAFSFFSHIPQLSGKLETMNKVGLSYIHLGQPATQLSGGEAQRVKLATELSKKTMKDTVFILDEPTTGLHFADLEKLLFVLRELVNMGNTVIVIEHNLDVIKNSDWVIDMGPEGGEKGGYIIAEGTPYDLAENRISPTGQFLAKEFKHNK